MTRHLVLVLGDQLSLQSSAFDQFDPAADRVWMAENDEEATHVWCHQYRLVAFFSPMRHFRLEVENAGLEIDYHELTANPRKAKGCGFASLLRASLKQHKPEKVVVCQPGDDRVQRLLQACCDEAGVPLEIREDRDFFCSSARFAEWAQGRKSLVMEQFYHVMRTEHDILMESKNRPIGEQWNFDKENRKKFPKTGPGQVPSPPKFAPDAITNDVMQMVSKRFPDHPGSLEGFDLPVTRDEALLYLQDFVEHRLASFGDFQDAMWEGAHFLYHSRLSHAMNLHLLSAQEVVEAVTAAYFAGKAPLAAVEGFVRQVLGWREYVRGIYWLHMPDYADRNSLECDADQEVPVFFWDGKTEMACVRDAMRLLIETAYAHHIQRLMVLGLFAQLFGVHPKSFHQWHMAMYADAIDWVSLPNALGMSQHGDGGLMATKPYCASGNYIDGMSNHCRQCRYKPRQATGDDACPFTTLYWDFLDRHQVTFRKNHRMVMQIKNLERKDKSEMAEIRERAQRIRKGEISV
jgi:deoxyribodipyrimidine photolyase-related protein